MNGVKLRDDFPTRMKREGNRGHGLRKRDSVASTERRREGKRFMDNACLDD